MAEEVKVLDFWGGMFGMRVRIALAEKGVGYEYDENVQLYVETRKIWMNKGEQQEAGKMEMIAILKQLEEVLGEKAFFGGERLGFIDIALIGFSTWFYSYETIGNFSIEAECPKIMV